LESSVCHADHGWKLGSPLVPEEFGDDRLISTTPPTASRPGKVIPDRQANENHHG